MTSILPPFTFYAVQPTASFPLDIFGGTRRAVERTKALADYETYELKAAYLTLYANIAADAFRNAGARAQIANLQDVIAGDQRNVDSGADRDRCRLRNAHPASQRAEPAFRGPHPDPRFRAGRSVVAPRPGGADRQAVGNWTMPASVAR